MSYILIVGVYSCFHFTTLEEYYLGTLILPIFNGVSDGAALILFFCISTLILGSNTWATPFIDGTWLSPSLPMLTYGQVLALAIGFANIFVSFKK